ncbi:SEC12-like protein 1 [Ananas comosus]|nr:SEC12-like protein 1 [Ananas comosus]
MEISHWSKKIHLGTRISSIEFCPTERVVISTSSQWGPMVTKLNVPGDWKEWQIYLVLLSLFLASAILCYIFYENSDSFWNFPLGRHQPAKPWNTFKPIDPSQIPDDQDW